jgi:hypothetical protein
MHVRQFRGNGDHKNRRIDIDAHCSSLTAVEVVTITRFGSRGTGNRTALTLLEPGLGRQSGPRVLALGGLGEGLDRRLGFLVQVRGNGDVDGHQQVAVAL